MRGLLLPLVLGLAGLGAGIGAGVMTMPPTDGGAATPDADAPPDTPREFARLSNQFVVPVIENGRVASMVILSLGVEVAAGETEAVFAREPRLRDAFLQVLFAHANAGGFRGAFTEAGAMAALRRALLEAAVAVLGPGASDILISDIIRQDS